MKAYNFKSTPDGLVLKDEFLIDDAIISAVVDENTTEASRIELDVSTLHKAGSRIGLYTCVHEGGKLYVITEATRDLNKSTLKCKGQEILSWLMVTRKAIKNDFFHTGIKGDTIQDANRGDTILRILHDNIVARSPYEPSSRSPWLNSKNQGIWRGIPNIQFVSVTTSEKFNVPVSIKTGDNLDKWFWGMMKRYVANIESDWNGREIAIKVAVEAPREQPDVILSPSSVGVIDGDIKYRTHANSPFFRVKTHHPQYSYSETTDSKGNKIPSVSISHTDISYTVPTFMSDAYTIDRNESGEIYEKDTSELYPENPPLNEHFWKIVTEKLPGMDQGNPTETNVDRAVPNTDAIKQFIKNHFGDMLENGTFQTHPVGPHSEIEVIRMHAFGDPVVFDFSTVAGEKAILHDTFDPDKDPADITGVPSTIKNGKRIYSDALKKALGNAIDIAYCNGVELRRWEKMETSVPPSMYLAPSFAVMTAEMDLWHKYKPESSPVLTLHMDTSLNDDVKPGTTLMFVSGDIKSKFVVSSRTISREDGKFDVDITGKLLEEY